MDQSAQHHLSNVWCHLNLEVRRFRTAFCDMAGKLGIIGGRWGACPIGPQPVFLADFDEAGASIIHNIEGSLFPNWEGQAQKRFLELSGNRLTLKTTPVRPLGRWRRD